jgi:aspartate kinase
MGVVVQKFGGSSLATPEKVLNAARRALNERAQGNDVVMVVSAQGDHTDELVAMARQIHHDPAPREMDALMAVGEQRSIALMAMAIHSLGHCAVSLTGGQAGIQTDSTASKARIHSIDVTRIRKELADGRVVIVAGFQGLDSDGNITTFGRGGSDTSAVALAAALHAERCDIHTDVRGVFTTDPRLVPEAQWIPQMDYDELLELASVGANVMHSRAVELAKRYNVPFTVRSSFDDSEGTLVTNLTDNMEQVDVRAAALDTNEAKLTLRGVPDKPGIAAEIFSEIASAGVSVDVIVQNVSADGRADVSFTVPKSDLNLAIDVTTKVSARLGAGEVENDLSVAKLSIVGIGMRSHTGVAQKMFSALAEAQVNILMITTSEIKISCVVDEENGQKALQAIHTAFELNEAAQAS